MFCFGQLSPILKVTFQKEIIKYVGTYVLVYKKLHQRI